MSIREIARRLGVHRETVGKYLSRLESQITNGDGGAFAVDFAVTRAPAKRAGTPSRCDPYRDLIIEKAIQGMSAQKIYQHLVSEQNFKGRYDSVRRYVAKLLNVDRTSSDATSTSPSAPTGCVG